VHFPHYVQAHLIAARYGQDPDDVDDWPADKFALAASLLKITGGRGA
jgi:hypothetical protein